MLMRPAAESYQAGLMMANLNPDPHIVFLETRIIRACSGFYSDSFVDLISYSVWPNGRYFEPYWEQTVSSM